MNTLSNGRNYHNKWNNNHALDFSKIGGLHNHIQLLREIIITPLIYGELFQHFNIKAPRGVLFFGPPGTGKTLIAGALATELNNDGNDKVTFIQRKGADILDKWVGESERKLRDLFEKAAKHRPSIIFFDELDGLAPERSHKNDQVHCSIVTTLLALMDGLDNMPGVIVIGATNRIDAIDPALRRPGRFDRELYFPLPTTIARREILQVHTNCWRYKPTTTFLGKLSELTTGCCGSDLQALCTEAVLCCAKRLYPDLNQSSNNYRRIRINLSDIKVDECDFLNARLNLVPTAHRIGTYKQRSLSQFIAPLLSKELDRILRHLHVFLPHFLEPDKKYLLGNERYAGRVVLKGNNQQGLYTHLLPAILQALEHLPCYVLEVPHLIERTIRNVQQQLPSILVLSRVDEWWDTLENSVTHLIKSILEDFHAGLPLLVIVTCVELPEPLREYFYNNSSIIFNVEDPSKNERESFFRPLFYNVNPPSMLAVWNKQNYTVTTKHCSHNLIEINESNEKIDKSVTYNTRQKRRWKQLRKEESTSSTTDEANLKRKLSLSHLINAKKLKYNEVKCELENSNADRENNRNDDYNKNEYVRSLDANLRNWSKYVYNSSVFNIKNEPVQMLAFGKNVYSVGDSKVMDRSVIDIIWNRVLNVTSADLQITQLELLYDTIKGCIHIYPMEFTKLIQAVKEILISFESFTHR